MQRADAQSENAGKKCKLETNEGAEVNMQRRARKRDSDRERERKLGNGENKVKHMLHNYDNKSN